MRTCRPTGERGDSGPTQLVMLAGVLVLFFFGVFWVGRFIIAEGALDEVARNAARAASLGPDAATGQSAALTAAQDTLAAQGLNCVGVDLDVDTSGFAAPIGAPAQVAVTVSCTVSNADLAFPGIPGDVQISASFTSPIDSYRSR